MDNDLIERVAFAIQDETIHRLKAQRLARAAIAAIQNGDELGRGMVAVYRMKDAVKEASPLIPGLWRSTQHDFAISDVSALKPTGEGTSFECLRRLADATRD